MPIQIVNRIKYTEDSLKAVILKHKRPKSGNMKYLKFILEKGATCKCCGQTARSILVCKDGHKTFYLLSIKGPTVILTLDHILPKSQGGAMIPDNIQILCNECNNKKANSHIKY